VPEIRYQFALGADGELVDIRDHARRTPVTCYGCGGRMVGRHGNSVVHHFAHAPSVPSCGEGALHKLAKKLIVDGFNAAKTQDAPAYQAYPLTWPCTACGTRREADVKKIVGAVREETSAVAGTVSDLFFHADGLRGQRDFVVELVVTHHITARTQERYAAARVPVFVVDVLALEDIRSLRVRIDAARAYNLDAARCGGCRARTQRAYRFVDGGRRLIITLGSPRECNGLWFGDGLAVDYCVGLDSPDADGWDTQLAAGGVPYRDDDSSWRAWHAVTRNPYTFHIRQAVKRCLDGRRG
jgi:hypothetical protein